MAFMVSDMKGHRIEAHDNIAGHFDMELHSGREMSEPLERHKNAENFDSTVFHSDSLIDHGTNGQPERRRTADSYESPFSSAVS